MKKIVHLDTLEGLPGKFLDRLRKHNTLFKKNMILEHLMEEEPSLRSIVSDINAYCEAHHIKCYHYTRAEKSAILQNGLLSRTGEEIRSVFLEQHANRFTAAELESIREEWGAYFGGVLSKQARDHRIFFNTTMMAMHNGDAELLLNYYGGEQIHRPLDGKDNLLQKLSLIGSPLVVIFNVSGAEPYTYGPDYPWGMTAVSSYHRLINSEADWVYADAYVTKPVTSKNIMEIRVM